MISRAPHGVEPHLPTSGSRDGLYLVLMRLRERNTRQKSSPGAEVEAGLSRSCSRSSCRPRDRLHRAGIRPSVGTVGCALDPMADVWVATYKHELVRGRVFRGMEHVDHETLRWIVTVIRECDPKPDDKAATVRSRRAVRSRLIRPSASTTNFNASGVSTLASWSQPTQFEV